VTSVETVPQPAGWIVIAPQAPQEVPVPAPDAVIGGSTPSKNWTFPEKGAAWLVEATIPSTNPAATKLLNIPLIAFSCSCLASSYAGQSFLSCPPLRQQGGPEHPGH
jgi:hypothetical protein